MEWNPLKFVTSAVSGIVSGITGANPATAMASATTSNIAVKGLINKKFANKTTTPPAVKLHIDSLSRGSDPNLYKSQGTNENGDGTDKSDVSKYPNEDSSKCKFNLPPHKWSQPASVSRAHPMSGGKAMDPSLQPLRRGRIWRWLDYNEYYFDDSKTNTPPAGSAKALSDGEILKKYGYKSNTSNLQFGILGGPSYQGIINKAILDNLPMLREQEKKKLNFNTASESNWGFQFLWNPDGISINTDVNMSVTPNVNDMFSTVSQAYPTMQSISVSVMLDRTNDFACFRGMKNSSGYSETELAEMMGFYPNAYGVMPNPGAEIKELLLRGTMYDLEYLYRSINGNPPSTNFMSKETADMGFLTPSQIAFQLGPDKNSIAYLGYINSLQVQHMTFTEEMIPIRTQVTMSISVLTDRRKKES